MNVLMSYRRFGRARSLRSDRAEHAFGRCVATLFELLSDDSRFLRKVFRKEKSISKKYLSKKVFVFFFGDLDVNFVGTVFDPNTVFLLCLSSKWRRVEASRRNQEGYLDTRILTIFCLFDADLPRVDYSSGKDTIELVLKLPLERRQIPFLVSKAT
ncbi:hypothetical protein F2Q69_00042924 [Brassica cretica]|uniref:Uncharacterized protein n=1 Tax=Brassica cretica TaxID=69181 RepID=A0A8S9NB03_BRACR|nr:hypothetical protein F2Q69_00042924 [Brassica cretica]